MMNTIVKKLNENELKVVNKVLDTTIKLNSKQVKDILKSIVNFTTNDKKEKNLLDSAIDILKEYTINSIVENEVEEKSDKKGIKEKKKDKIVNITPKEKEIKIDKKETILLEVGNQVHVYNAFDDIYEVVEVRESCTLFKAINFVEEELFYICNEHLKKNVFCAVLDTKKKSLKFTFKKM